MLRGLVEEVGFRFKVVDSENSTQMDGKGIGNEKGKTN